MDARKALVQFYSDHCVHCRDMKESIKAVETKYKHDATVIVTRVDGNIESSLADSENIRGYPTINIYTSDPITGTWRFRKECDGRKTDEMISCIENV